MAHCFRLMSWDILLLNPTAPVDFETDSWAEFECRTALIARFQQTFPDSHWADPSWGTLHNDHAAIEFNLGRAEEPGNMLMLHVYGGQDPVSEPKLLACATSTGGAPTT